MTSNGEPVVTGTTLSVMGGNPAASVAWLVSVNRLTESGTTLPAGSVVLTGAMASAQAAAPAISSRSISGGLGGWGYGSGRSCETHSWRGTR